jgi:xylulokinase
VVLGIDLGTQGVRVLAVDPQGAVLASTQQTFQVATPNLPPGWLEQSPQDWWRTVCACLRDLTTRLPAGMHIAGISVDSTSGTILPVDAQGAPLHPAVMYNDQRSEPQVAAVRIAGAAHQARLGYVFGSSFALPKIRWFQQERPAIFAQTRRFLHAADWIAGCLTGEFRCSDTSNALKTGYDLLDLRWPDFIARDLGIPLGLLPEVVLPGESTGHVSPQAASETGLPAGVLVLAGATDGTAAQIASGAVSPGDWNSTLGTTLVLKGISRRLALDPQGRIYSHRHPDGGWMPGGASNTGSEWITVDHPSADPADLDRQAAGCIPTRLVRFPLCKRGERFPFVDKDAAGFLLGQPQDEAARYAAGLEGLAYLERLAYQTLAEIGLEVGERIYVTGGGSHSRLWSRVRASVLEKELAQPAVPETAMGAAMLGASHVWFSSVGEAAASMVKVAQVVEPEPAWLSRYEEGYAAFLGELRRRGYVEGGG